MTHSEVATLLALCAAVDRRTTGEADVSAWQALLDDIRFDDAREVVLDHYRLSSDWLTPAQIRRGVRRLRERRTQRIDEIQPPDDLDVRGYIEWKRRTVQALADGTFVDYPALPRQPRDVVGLIDEEKFTWAPPYGAGERA